MLSAEDCGDGSVDETPVPVLLYTVFSSSNSHASISPNGVMKFHTFKKWWLNVQRLFW